MKAGLMSTLKEWTRIVTGQLSHSGGSFKSESRSSLIVIFLPFVYHSEHLKEIKSLNIL